MYKYWILYIIVKRINKYGVNCGLCVLVLLVVIIWCGFVERRRDGDIG